jgi:hypothetical protein
MSRSYLVLLTLIVLITVATATSLQRCADGEVQESIERANTASVATPPTDTSPVTPTSVTPNPPDSGTDGIVASTARERASVGQTGPSLAPHGHIDGLRLRLSQPVTAESETVRGLAVGDDAVYIATTVTDGTTGMLYRLQRDLLTVVQKRDLSQDAHTLVGGLHLSGDTLWAPVADGAVSSPSRGSTHILALDPHSLETRQGFVVEDQIAFVVQAPNGHLVGFNDEGTQAYKWTTNGQEIQRQPLTTGAIYRDAEIVGENLVSTGVDRQGGVLDVIDLDSLTIIARHRCEGANQSRAHLTEHGFGVAPELRYAGYEGEALFYFAVPGTHAPMLLSYELQDMPLDQWLLTGPLPQP